MAKLQQIRITKTPQIQQALDIMQRQYPLLDDSELIKVSLSKTITEDSLTDEEKYGISQSKQDIQNGDYTPLSGEKEIEKHFSKL